MKEIQVLKDKLLKDRAEIDVMLNGIDEIVLFQKKMKNELNDIKVEKANLSKERELYKIEVIDEKKKIIDERKQLLELKEVFAKKDEDCNKLKKKLADEIKNVKVKVNK